MCNFIKHLPYIILLCFLGYSCKTKSAKNIVSEVRQDFSENAAKFSETTLRTNRLEDSLYYLASINLDSGINAIDKIIGDGPTYSPYYKIKGDFYYKYKKYREAKGEYSKSLNLDQYSNARVFRASCYLNLILYDSCLTDLELIAKFNHDSFWYIGNYYEARSNLDSAISYYFKLYGRDTTVYKYCKERIDYLQNNSNPKIFTELMLRDTARLTINLR